MIEAGPHDRRDAVPDFARQSLRAEHLGADAAAVFGRLADRFGRKLMLIRSLAGFTVIVDAMGLVTSVEQLLAARVLQGLFAGFTARSRCCCS